MPKPHTSDVRGMSIAAVLSRIGFAEFTQVRQGKRFEFTHALPIDDDALARARSLAEDLLANPREEEVVSVRSAE